jgi:hopanoid biosynthesis associated RND transporter like protein HpnN
MLATDPPEDQKRLVRGISRWVAWVARNARAVTLVTLALTPLFGLYASLTLGFNTDPSALFSSHLRFQRLAHEFSQYFPILTDALLIVVDGETPERTREAATALRTHLESKPEIFGEVYVPAENEFFERNGLLYLDLDDVEEFADHMARLQPVIGELSSDASLPTLTRLIRIGLEETRVGGLDDDTWRSVSERFRTATAHVYAEQPIRVSWESVMLDGSSFQPTTRRLIVGRPPLDFSVPLNGGKAIGDIRRAVAELGIDGDGRVQVRISGYPALNYEEMVHLVWDVGVAGIVSLMLVVAVLSVAFRSTRLVAAAGVTLIVGLIWTGALAALTVGEFNSVSIACAVLFVGLGIDFMIHLGLHVREAISSGLGVGDALQSGVRSTGTALVLCAATTAIGFLSFVPTHYRGLSHLGVISAGAMIVILAQTLTLFPALLSLWLGPLQIQRIRATQPRRVPMFPVARHPGLVCAVAAAAAATALWLAPHVHLDMNVVRLRDASTESVQAFNDLLESDESTPWFIDVMAPSLDEADRLSRRFAELDVVERSMTLSDYVPEDQDAKIEILGDVSMMLDIPPNAGGRREAFSQAEQIAALRDLSDLLAQQSVSRPGSPLAESLEFFRAELARFLGRIENTSDPTAALETLETSLLARLPEQLDRLRASLEPQLIAMESLPTSLSDRMLGPSGQARVQVFPTEKLVEREDMVRFVEATRAVSENVTGLPVNLVDSAAATADSLVQAMLWAAGAIGLVLLVAWRRVLDTALVLLPLLLAAGLTATATYALGISFNFGNIVVLPLLLGVGIDSGVHLVQRFREKRSSPRELLGSTTAQAVFYSSLTTVASFGSLAFAGHNGLASLGKLLVVGMIIALLCTLVVLPALIAVSHRSTPRP